MSDEELDRNWQPNGRRPQSTIAKSFSAELMDIFRIENSVADLDNQVDQRRKVVGQSNDELASLEARLKEMEERLNRSQHTRSHTLSSVDTAAANASQNQAASSNLQAIDEAGKARSRPGTAKAAQPAPSSGNMPPTPGASEGEYYLVTKDDLLNDDRR